LTRQSEIDFVKYFLKFHYISLSSWAKRKDKPSQASKIISAVI
jgi:hypothetical protein